MSGLNAEVAAFEPGTTNPASSSVTTPENASSMEPAVSGHDRLEQDAWWAAFLGESATCEVKHGPHWAGFE